MQNAASENAAWLLGVSRDRVIISSTARVPSTYIGKRIPMVMNNHQITAIPNHSGTWRFESVLLLKIRIAFYRHPQSGSALLA